MRPQRLSETRKTWSKRMQVIYETLVDGRILAVGKKSRSVWFGKEEGFVYTT